MFLKKALKRGIFLKSLLAIIVLTSCSRVTLYPIEKRDIIAVEKGDKIKTQNGTIELDRPGYFLSEEYMTEVMRAKTE